MPLEETFTNLTDKLTALGETIKDHYPIVVYDGPRDTDLGFIWTLENGFEDISGGQNECLEAARIAQRAVADDRDLDKAQRALAQCEKHIHSMLKAFHTDFTYREVANLYTIGKKDQRKWDSWAMMVVDSLQLVFEQVVEANHAHCKCWQEIAERAGATSLSMKTTNIGQQITTTDSSVQAELEPT